MKIAILSSFYPYRGGIAQFNANIFEELGKKHDVKAFTFSRQYPDFLFPGKTQYVTPDDEAVAIESEVLLDTANPFTYIKTARRIREWDPDILVIRYWMSYFGPSLGYVCRHMKKRCKVMSTLKRVFTLRLTDEVFDRIQEIAASEHRSMTNLIEYILIKHIEELDRAADQPAEH